MFISSSSLKKVPLYVPTAKDITAVASFAAIATIATQVAATTLGLFALPAAVKSILFTTVFTVGVVTFSHFALLAASIALIAFVIATVQAIRKKRAQNSTPALIQTPSSATPAAPLAPIPLSSTSSSGSSAAPTTPLAPIPLSAASSSASSAARAQAAHDIGVIASESAGIFIPSAFYIGENFGPSTRISSTDRQLNNEVERLSAVTSFLFKELPLNGKIILQVAQGAALVEAYKLQNPNSAVNLEQLWGILNLEKVKGSFKFTDRASTFLLQLILEVVLSDQFSDENGTLHIPGKQDTKPLTKIDFSIALDFLREHYTVSFEPETTELKPARCFLKALKPFYHYALDTSRKINALAAHRREKSAQSKL